ncbi:asparagine synthase (glutamine-hydrolyzing) [Paucibacter aquatile]|uniref:asparagine synthase (glutamine-hydrolyzing) n=1 Tax=Kinneretia aquatilis TaxID=2070761 RepID=A0A2N8KWG4_9BURK|nr:asparagine synthase (glutamine-hydrolyzing) [Paucibacter aquatile]PND37780.1 asparagine synthase (glutamine-hydrolyzing) [Paucibacter aquatile]
MCGIAGFTALNRDSFESAEAILLGQLDRIARRGPDSQGAWFDRHLGVALGHRRLAIVELSSAGHQPMISPGERYVITYNGEIYNHHEIRESLTQQNRAPVWRGHSDTETLIAAIEAWGIQAALSRCVGMFSFALLDRQEGRLYLARDRFGEKPLYYGISGQGKNHRFVFASELSAITTVPGFNTSLNPVAIGGLLQFGYIGAPETIYEKVHQLSPASLLELDLASGAMTVRSYWDPIAAALQARQNPFKGNDTDAIDALDAVLGRAIEDQMVADVPLGAFLSGGIDSTTVVAMMARRSPKRVRTFTIGFHEAAHNEAPFAREVARHLGTEHTEHYLSDQEALDIIPKLPEIYSEPFGDSSQIPTYLVAKLARQHVAVSLSGDAGDELFAGYNRYMFANSTWRKLQRIPGPLRRGAAQILACASHTTLENLGKGYHAIASNRAGISNFPDKATKAIRVLGARHAEDLYHGAVSFWHPSPMIGYDRQHQAIQMRHGLGAVESMMLMDTVNYLPGDILHKVDRACMGVSLEGRIPFLDHRVYEFAWSLPMNYKIRDGQSKWLLRRLLDRHVPRSLMERPKMGFALPLAAWLRGPLRPWAEHLLSEHSLREVPGLDGARVISAWRIHLEGRRNMTEQLWPILSLQAWRQAR